MREKCQLPHLSQKTATLKVGHPARLQRRADVISKRQKPSRTILPMEVWDSMAAWAARRLAALMRPATCAEGGADESFIDKCRYLFEDAVLLDHVGGLEDGAGEHGLPVQGGGFGLELADVDEGGIVDEGEGVPAGAMSSTISSKC